jgi:LysM repeat protein
MGTFAHTVRYRETLWVIARKYNTTVNAILAVNPGIDPYNLRIGQIICIPMTNNFFR